MTGMPCCCPLTADRMPTITIAGMTAVSSWTFVPATCCAIICFDYDTEQALQKNNVGATMTYDKTDTCVAERYYYPYTCGQKIQAFWSLNPYPHSGVPGDGDYVLWPNEPAYTGCCSDPVSLNTLTKTIRQRGGQQFVVATQPYRICITLQKVMYTCGANPPVEKFILTFKKLYRGHYAYRSYEQITVDYSYTNSDPLCWNITANTSTGSPTYDPAEWDGLSGIAIDFETCRQKLLDALPTSNTNYTFATGDILTLCTLDRSACATCVTTPICFNSGLTGTSTPSAGFCDATTAGTVGTKTDTIKTCGQHNTYLWSNDSQSTQVSAGEVPPDTSNLECKTETAVDRPYSQYWGSPPVLGHTWTDIAQCDKTYTWNTIEQSTWICGAPSYKTGASLLCMPTSNCPQCPTGTQGPGGADVNLVVATTLAGPVALQTYTRTISISRSVTCSGYMQQEICLTYLGGTITINPSPFMKNFGMESTNFLGDMT